MYEFNKEQTVDSSKKLKWTIAILGIPAVLLWLILGALFGFGLLFAFLSSLGAPTTTKSGAFLGIATILLVLFLYIFPLVITGWLYLKKKYVAVLIIIIFVLCGVLFYTGKSILEPLLGRIGINIPIKLGAPRNILVISDRSLPDEYFRYKRGTTFDEKYILSYFARSKKDKEINFSYTNGQLCKKSDKKTYEKISCTPGGSPHECYVETLIPGSKIKTPGGEIQSKSYDVTYLIDDNNSCVRVHFRAPNEAEALSLEQMLTVINSLERV